MQNDNNLEKAGSVLQLKGGAAVVPGSPFSDGSYQRKVMSKIEMIQSQWLTYIRILASMTI